MGTAFVTRPYKKANSPRVLPLPTNNPWLCQSEICLQVLNCKPYGRQEQSAEIEYYL